MPVLASRAALLRQAAAAAPPVGAGPLDNNWQTLSAASGAGLTLSYAVGAGSNRILVVATGGKGAPTAGSVCQPTGVTFGGVALTKIVGINTTTAEAGSLAGCALWGVVAPTVQTANIVVTWAETLNAGIALYAVYLTDAEQALPTTLVNSAQSTLDSSSMTLAINSVPDSSLVLDAHQHHDATARGLVTTGTDQTAAFAPLFVSTSHFFGSKRAVTIGGNITFGWSQTGGGWGRRADVMAAFKKAA